MGFKEKKCNAALQDINQNHPAIEFKMHFYGSWLVSQNKKQFKKVILIFFNSQFWLFVSELWDKLIYEI